MDATAGRALPPQEGLTALRERVEKLARGSAGDHGVLPFGVSAIDAALPDGGLARGALHEIGGFGGDEEDGAVAAAFLTGILARLAPPAPVLWCHTADDLYGPGFVARGLAPNRLISVRARDNRTVLEAMEDGLKVPALSAVVGEVGSLPLTASRRLQLAAAASGVTAFVLRRWRTGALASAERAAPVAATTRWRVSALPSRPVDGEPGLGRLLWSVELTRCRGGVPAHWILEACDATGHVALAAELADRAPAPAKRQPLRAVG
ncbi:MAG TPA: damage-inducible protein [Stellaceae bacterium]|nr:damage-inducible protein [Stellaceae bacterium]